MNIFRDLWAFLFIGIFSCLFMPELAVSDENSTLLDGKKVFIRYCILCHGQTGKGDGRMAKLLKNPGPANLTRSTLSMDEMKNIILEGGGGVGKSENMPSWKDVLSDQDFNALIPYVMNLRNLD